MKLMFTRITFTAFLLSIAGPVFPPQVLGQTTTFSTDATVGIKREFFPNIPGTSIASLTSHPSFPGNPSVVEVAQHENGQPSDFRFPASASGYPASAPGPLDFGNTFGQRFSGYLLAPVSGDYIFWVGGDTSTELFLSTGTNPANKVKIAWTSSSNTINGSTKLPVWLSNNTTSGRSTNNNFIFNGGLPGVVRLSAGKLYYIEALQKENVSIDAIAVGWTKPGDTVNASGPTEVIPCEYLTPNLAAVPDLQLGGAEKVSRFLAQAGFGPKPEDLDPNDPNSLLSAYNANLNAALSQWIDDQFAMTVTDNDRSLPLFKSAFNFAGTFTSTTGYHNRTKEAGAIRAGLMIDTKHQLRLKLAYVLSQILVTSENGSNIQSRPFSYCSWHDLLFNNAFEKYDKILREVTAHPVMGHYLTHVKSAKASFYSAGSRPDENYARELMQLFTIGLYKLQLNGEFLGLDIEGQPLPTYNNADIVEFAQVFTGLIYDPTVPSIGPTWGGRDGQLYTVPMVPYKHLGLETRHDTSSKLLLSGSLAAQTTANVFQDVNGAIANLVTNPSTAPFVSKALIQKFVTSNPSPEYIEDVATVFRDSGGDMKLVVKAILLHTEARSTTSFAGDASGKLREPFLRYIQLARAFPAKAAPGQPRYSLYRLDLYPLFGQFPLASPSVFNFYLPSYEPPGDVTARNNLLSQGATRLVGPEFQILNDNTVIATANHILDTLNATDPVLNTTDDKRTANYSKSGYPLALELGTLVQIAGDTNALVEHVNLMLTGGMMSESTREIIKSALDSVAVNLTSPTAEEKTARARLAVYLAAISPDFAVQK